MSLPLLYFYTDDGSNHVETFSQPGTVLGIVFYRTGIVLWNSLGIVIWNSLGKVLWSSLMIISDYVKLNILKSCRVYSSSSSF